MPRSKDADGRYSNPDNDPRGPWQSDNLSVGPAVQENIYEIITPSGRRILPPSGRSWLYKEEIFLEKVKDNRIWFGKNKDGVPRVKRFLSDVKQGITPMTIWKYQDVGHSQKASQDLKKLFDDKAYFTYPKPVELIKQMLELYADKDALILDFFSGSSATAHATMQLNAEDGGKRKFIMVQLPEPTDEKSEAFKAGYKNISEIGKERVRRAGEKIKSERGLEALDLGIGFKVLKLDTSNIRKWQPDAANLEQSLLDYVDNFAEGRTELDVVYEVMLKYGLDLSYPVDEFSIAEKKVYSIGFGMLMICLDNEITTEIANGIIEKLEELRPESCRVVFKDNGFKTDSNKTNIKEIFKCAGIEEFITI